MDEKKTGKRPIRRLMQGPFPLEEKFNKLRTLWAVLVLAAAVIGIELISLFLTARHIPGLFVTYFSCPLVLLLNLAPLALLAVFLYVLTGFAWIGVIPSGLLLIVCTLINIFKIMLRGDPFLFSDIFLASEAGDIVQNYAIVFSKSQIACCIVLIIGFLLCVLLTGRIRLKGHWIVRGIIALICAGGMVALLLFVYPKNSIYKAHYAGATFISTRNDDEWYSAHGFTWAFLHSAVEEQMKIEAWTPEDEAEESGAAEENRLEGIPDDKKVNVIMIQLEAFCDLSEYLDNDAVAEAYTNFHQLQTGSITGHLLDNVNGGGTEDTERSVMTGFSMLPDFTSGPCNSYIWYLRSKGYYVEGSHPGNNWFYDRETVNADLGFENYWFSENMYEELVSVDTAPYDSDEILFTRLVELMEESDEPYFSVNISYQNHGPYESRYLRDGAEERITAEDCSNAAARNIVNNYLYQISLTDAALKDMIISLTDYEEPTVVVLFGDHKPYLGDYSGLNTWEELGINEDADTDEGFFNHYSTPYVIWANTAAKETLNSACVGDGGDFGSCFLMNKLFQTLGWGGDELMQASDDLLAAGVTMIHSAVDAYYEDGELTDELSDEGKQALSKFLSVQAYWQSNFQYQDLLDEAEAEAEATATETGSAETAEGNR